MDQTVTPTATTSSTDIYTRLSALERFEAEARLQIMNLTEQMAAVGESQKAAERDEYVDLRRALLVIGLTGIAREWSYRVDCVWPWDELCAELYRRYGHLNAGNEALWTKPPKAPSDETKQLVAESLRRRQEA
jgi:hypothetical protein